MKGLKPNKTFRAMGYLKHTVAIWIYNNLFIGTFMFCFHGNVHNQVNRDVSIIQFATMQLLQSPFSITYSFTFENMKCNQPARERCTILAQEWQKRNIIESTLEWALSFCWCLNTNLVGTKSEQLNQLMAKYQECPRNMVVWRNPFKFSRLVPAKNGKKTCNFLFSTSKAFPNLDKFTCTIPKKDCYLQVQCIAEITFWNLS